MSGSLSQNITDDQASVSCDDRRIGRVRACETYLTDPFLDPSPRHLCESGLRENRTGRLSGGRRLASRGASSDPTPRKPRTKPSDIGGGDGGGKAVGRRKGTSLRMSRTQSRNWHVTEAAHPRIGEIESDPSDPKILITKPGGYQLVC